MISTSNGFLFVHIPKTAGNSVQTILKRYSDDKIITPETYQDGMERFQIANEQYDISKHSPLYEYKKELEPEIYNSLFKFSIIRNPWDRMISYYFSPHRGVKEWNREEFKSFLENIKTAKEFLTEYSLIDKILKYFGVNIGKETFNIDYILKFENLDNDFKKLCTQLNVPYEPLPQVNKSSKRKHYSYYYDDELRKIVEEKCSTEIQWGNYQFQEVTHQKK